MAWAEWTFKSDAQPTQEGRGSDSPALFVSSPMIRPGSIAVALVLLAGCAHQPAPVATTPQALPPVVSNDAPPGPTPVIAAQSGPCEQVRDGDRVARLQGAANDLMERLKADPAFGGAWFDHFPCYRFVLAFTDARLRPWAIEVAAPELRPFIAFAQSRLSHAERERAAKEIMSAVNAAGVQFAIFYSSLNPEEFVLGVRSSAKAQIARSAIPQRYRALTKVEVGSFERRPE